MDAQLETRIKQWETMVHEAPDDMAWLSLGSAYKDAQRVEDAERAYGEAIKLNPGMSRAYQLRGMALVELGREDEAAELLATGYTMAAERGDVMPQKAMGNLLEEMGRPVPEIAKAEVPPEVASGEQIIDRRTGRPGPRIETPPLRGPVGDFIADHFTQDTWKEWVMMGTKVINELRLDFALDQHQQIYEDHMLEWLGVDRAEIEAYAREKAGGE